MTTMNINSKTFKEVAEYPDRTEYSNSAVATTSPESISITQKWNKKPNSKRSTTLTCRKVVPYKNENGVDVVEVIQLSTRLTHLPGRLASDKLDIIKLLFKDLIKVISSDDVQVSLVAGEHNLNLDLK